MGRVINPETAGKERNRLTKSIVLAIRELMVQTSVDSRSKDLAAYICMALETIAESIDASVGAWEKRGYWVKADRYRMEWIWSERYAKEMRAALVADDWAKIAQISAQVAEKLKTTKVSPRHRMGTPWVGAWRKMSSDMR